MCYNFKKLAGSFSLTLIALISYLFLNAENLIFLKAKFGKLARFGRVVPFKAKFKAKHGKGVSLWDGLGFSFCYF
ncbi:TPA: hypothetical protein R9130_000536 [Campylobacter upsaliensis]|nr:hypothetical protein [Campylobacter upsaliensis]